MILERVGRWRIGDAVIDVPAGPVPARMVPAPARGLRILADGSVARAEVAICWSEVAAAELQLNRSFPREAWPQLLRTFGVARAASLDRQREVIVMRDAVAGVSLDLFLEALSEQARDGSAATFPPDIACAVAKFIGDAALRSPSRVDPTQFFIAWDGSLHVRPDLQPRAAEAMRPSQALWITAEERELTLSMKMGDPPSAVTYRIAAALTSLLTPEPQIVPPLMRFARLQGPWRFSDRIDHKRKDVDVELAALIDSALSRAPDLRPAPEKLVEICDVRSPADDEAVASFLTGFLQAAFPGAQEQDAAAWEDLAVTDVAALPPADAVSIVDEASLPRATLAREVTLIEQRWRASMSPLR